MSNTRKLLISPRGTFIDQVVLFSMPGASVCLDNEGNITDWSSDDSPNLRPWETDSGVKFVYNDDGEEFLDRHCRIIEVDEDFDEWDLDGKAVIEPWPDEIVQACGRLARLEDSSIYLKRFETSLPEGFDDTTIKVVLDKVIRGRIEDEIAQLEKLVTEFRAGRIEPTGPTCPPDEETDEAA